MRMKLRNAGFELGSTKFWSVVTSGSLVIEDSEINRGSYSGKITTDAGSKWAFIKHHDLIQIDEGAIVNYGIWIKGVAGDTFYFKARTYDINGVVVDSVEMKTVTLSGSWQHVLGQYVAGNEDVYVQLYVDIRSAVGSAINYIDDASCTIMNADESLYRAEEIAYILNETTSGDTTADKHRLLGLKEYYAEINVTSMTGTTPTCDVTVCERDQSNNERVLGTFTQFNAITDQRVGIAPPIGTGVYVNYVMGGTVTNCRFKVYVIGVR